MSPRRRALVDVVARPELAGAAYVLALVSAAAWKASRDKRVLGVDASQITDAITSHFADHVHRVGLLLVAIAIVVGVLLGALAHLLVRVRASLRGLDSPRGARLVLSSLAVVVALHAFAVVHGMASRPQLYDEAFYDRGGVLRLVQVTATDLLGPRGVVALGLVLLLAWVAPPRSKWARARRAVERASPALAAIGALSLLGFAGSRVAHGTPSFAHDKQPNVLVLAADSLRADRIPSRAAPSLSALAATSTSFDRAYVSLPRTFPSWVTLLSGRWPHHHGIRNMFPSRHVRERDFDALPKHLAQAGYATSVVSDYAGDIFPRIDLGFDRVDAPSFSFADLIRQRALEPQAALLPFLDTRLGRRVVPTVLGMNSAPDADLVADRTLDAIDASNGRPFFVLAFFSTAHFPYAAPSPGYARFTDPKYRGRFKYQKMNRLGREEPPDDDDVRQVRALYDGAVSVIDDAAERVLDGLRARGLDRDTIVVVTADHGETLFEHGRGHGHGDHLFGEEALRVPFVIHDGRSPRAGHVSAIVRDVDLAPTLYELTGTAAPRDLDGRSVAPALRGESLAPVESFAETGLWFTEDVQGVPPELRLPYPDISRMTEVVRTAGDDVVMQDRFFPITVMAKHRAIVSGKWKLVLAPTRQGLRAMLFDVETDPGCTTDLADREPETTKALRGRLLAWILDDPQLELRGQHLVPRAALLAKTSDDAGAFRLEATQ